MDEAKARARECECPVQKCDKCSDLLNAAPLAESLANLVLEWETLSHMTGRDWGSIQELATKYLAAVKAAKGEG